MFESAELGHSVDKKTWDKEVPKLREALLAAQYDVLTRKEFPVVVLVGGVDGAGRGETVNLLNEWLDPRHVSTHAMGPPTDEESDRPPMWRFWRELPPRGKIGIFFGSWYTAPIVDRVYRRTKPADLDQALEEIVRFERMLAAEGALIVKLWLHLSKEAQRKRLKALEKDPDTRWRVTKDDWKRFALYPRWRETSEHALRETSRAEAPWTIVEGVDPRYRSLTVGNALLAAIKERLERTPTKPTVAPAPAPSVDGLQVLKALDLKKALPKPKYEKELEKYQERLARLFREPRFQKRHSVVAAFEGNDAAGKGGAIRRVVSALDARQVRTVPIAAPTEEERAQPYLWRFWRPLPPRGQLLVFDRTWYGRVLVERVEGFCAEADWRRAYGEINDFEEQLVRHGIVLVKFWLAIGKDEQLARFKEREKTGFKRYKIGPEDWRNREKWDAYEAAVCEMVDRTSSEIAPWTLVESNDKYFARIKILKTLCERVEAAL
ncbi:MAG: polyphosphate:AMP phosphotransferase [Acidobacteria bacterium]|nr:MAG: polyphosphate:AMP phosphotransferase [Acidobacteriota bacterium]MCE7958564.1 polyphosphate:AMP phosphotransferase [Acidobacteria bacterium ACB2]